MATLSEPTYVDVLVDLPEPTTVGQILITVMKDGRYRIATRPNTDHSTSWGPPMDGVVIK
jgi:hypothetical protein